MRRFVCEVPSSGDPTTIQPPTIPPPQACSEETPEDGWILFSKDQGGTDEFCYFFQNDNDHRFDWIKAYDGCVEKGGRLASISSEQENNFVMNKLKNEWEDMHPNPAGWIGYQRDSKTGQFRWVDGNKDLEYESWGPNGKYLGHLFPIESNFHFNIRT